MPSRLELIKLCPRRYITTYAKKGRIKKNTNPFIIFLVINFIFGIGIKKLWKNLSDSLLNRSDLFVDVCPRFNRGTELIIKTWV